MCLQDAKIWNSGGRCGAKIKLELSKISIGINTCIINIPVSPWINGKLPGCYRKAFGQRQKKNF